jgi:peptidyl-prolyl cis-trans isomerase D
MLQWINDRMKVIGWIFILPLALVFAVWGVHGLVDFTQRADRALTVNGEEVSSELVRRAYQNQVAELHRAFPDEIPQDIQTQLKQSIVDRYVNTELLNQKTNALGYVVAEREVVEALQNFEPFRVNGAYNRDAADAWLRANGISVAQFEAEQRQDLRLRQFAGGINVSSFATAKEIEAAARLRGEQRELAYAVVPVARYLEGAKPDDAAVQAYYDAHAADFMTPESVTLAYVRLKLDDVAAEVPVDEAALRSYYESVKARYVEPEKRHARHILIQSGADDAAARQKAQEVLELANKPGADFAALAKQYSQDAGSAAQGGDLGWAERSFFVGPFADALFAMKVGEIAGPVKTQFGWHVIKLEEVQAGQQKTFEQVRAELEPEYRRAEAERLFGDRQEKLDELAFENSGSLEGVASALKLPVQTIPGFTKAQGGGDLGANPAVLKAAFAPDVLGGQNSRGIELAPGDVVVLRASDHRLPEKQPLEAVRERAYAGAKRELAAREAKAAAERLVQQLQSGTDWPAALKAIGPFVTPAPDKPAAADALRFQPAKFVGRTEAGVASEILSGAFRGPVAAGKPLVGSVVLASGDVGVYAVTATKPGTIAPGERESEARQLASAKAQAEVFGYLRAMRAKADVHYNPAIFD